MKPWRPRAAHRRSRSKGVWLAAIEALYFIALGILALLAPTGTSSALKPTAVTAKVSSPIRAPRSATSSAAPKSSSPTPSSPRSSAHVALTRQQVFEAVSVFSDWSPTLMTRIAWCESRWEPWVSNPVAVRDSTTDPRLWWLPRWPLTALVHSTGLLGVLGGSADVTVNVEEAHVLWIVQGYGAWSGDFSSGCA